VRASEQESSIDSMIVSFSKWCQAFATVLESRIVECGFCISFLSVEFVCVARNFSVLEVISIPVNYINMQMFMEMKEAE
jgi:hypothetical protein